MTDDYILHEPINSTVHQCSNGYCSGKTYKIYTAGKNALQEMAEFGT